MVFFVINGARTTISGRTAIGLAYAKLAFRCELPSEFPTLPYPNLSPAALLSVTDDPTSRDYDFKDDLEDVEEQDIIGR